MAAKSGGTGNFNTTGAICFAVPNTMLKSAWSCSNCDGRTLAVNGVAFSLVNGTNAMPPSGPWSDGNYYFAFSAGTYSWASMVYW